MPPTAVATRIVRLSPQKGKPARTLLPPLTLSNYFRSCKFVYNIGIFVEAFFRRRESVGRKSTQPLRAKTGSNSAGFRRVRRPVPSGPVDLGMFDGNARIPGHAPPPQRRRTEAHNGSSETRLRLSSQSRDSTDPFRMTIPTIITHFADRVGLGDMALHGAVRRPKSGLIDADFGRGVIKQRTARTCAGPLLSVTRNLEACAQVYLRLCLLFAPRLSAQSGVLTWQDALIKRAFRRSRRW